MVFPRLDGHSSIAAYFLEITSHLYWNRFKVVVLPKRRRESYSQMKIMTRTSFIYSEVAILSKREQGKPREKLITSSRRRTDVPAQLSKWLSTFEWRGEFAVLDETCRKHFGQKCLTLLYAEAVHKDDRFRRGTDPPLKGPTKSWLETSL